MKSLALFTFGFLALSIPFGFSLKKDDRVLYRATSKFYAAGSINEFLYYNSLFQSGNFKSFRRQISDEAPRETESETQISLIELVPYQALLAINVSGSNSAAVLAESKQLAESFKNFCDQLDLDEVRRTQKIEESIPPDRKGDLTLQPRDRNLQIIEIPEDATIVPAGTNVLSLLLGCVVAGVFGGQLALGIGSLLTRGSTSKS